MRSGRKSSTSIPTVARGVASRAQSATAIARLWLTEPTAPGGKSGAPRGVESMRLGRLHPDGGERRAQRHPPADPPRAPGLRPRARERRLHRGEAPPAARRRGVLRQRHADANPEGEVEQEPALEGHRYLAATSAATSARTCASSASLPTATGNFAGRRRASQTTCQLSAPPGATVS